jgi:hypothetical protein
MHMSAIREAREAWAKQRRDPVRVYALALFAHVRTGAVTHCEAFARIVEFAAALLHDYARRPRALFQGPAELLTRDMMALFVGEGFTTDKGRYRGPHYVEISGSTGFRQEFQEVGNQIQHAAAGIILGFRHGVVGQAVAMAIEEEPQDDALYEASFRLGRELDNDGYKRLGVRIREVIGNGSGK